MKVFQKNGAASDRQRSYRPALDCLEDRCLLSAGYAQINLASDVPGLARVTDPSLVNPWGIAFSPTGPFWLADNGSGVSGLLDGRGLPVPLEVTVPSPGRSGSRPTGAVFSGGPGFAVSANGATAPSRFLFASENGTISGWSGVVDPIRALVAVDNSSFKAVYKGLALADRAGQSFLYAADFSRARIEVFDQHFKEVARPGAFQDPNLPAGFAPFNIENIDNQLFVTYAMQDTARQDDVAGAGHGFIDVYDTAGSLVRRFASGGPLNSPWGLALAPASFGPFGGALLVGNVGDGHINAFNPESGAFLGPLANDSRTPITIPTVWSLAFGNGHEGGNSDTLFFTAGMDYEQHGLFGAIQPPGRRGADTAGAGSFDPHAPGEPGDYPLPPRGGPFRAGNEDRSIPVSDLLPLRESSLALVPTLSVVQANTAIRAPLPPSRRDSSNDVVALGTFLDLNASANVFHGKQEAQASNIGTHAIGNPGRSWSDGGAESESVFSEAYIEHLAQSGEHDSAGQADEGFAAKIAASRAGSMDQGAVGNESIASQNGASWTNLTNLLFVVGFSMIWTNWLRHQTKWLHASREHDRSDRDSATMGPAPKVGPKSKCFQSEYQVVGQGASPE
jgi:uncharacterized protein (TIGR03118 family)